MCILSCFFFCCLTIKQSSSYQQSGENVKQDDFILTITDGIQTSTPLEVPIEIKPRILQGNKWHQLVNNTILVKENSSVTLTPSVFPMDTTDMNASPTDISAISTAPQYFVIVFPTKGNLLIDHKNKVSQFTYKDILENRLSYRHGPAEIGVKSVYDFARIWDFNAGETFSLNFTIMPVNSQPPVLRSETLLQVSFLGIYIYTDSSFSKHFVSYLFGSFYSSIHKQPEKNVKDITIISYHDEVLFYFHDK